MRRIVKKFNLLYFLPAIICFIVIIITMVSDTLYFTNYTAIAVNIAVMLFAGITMCKGKIWGAILTVIFYGGLSVWDYYFKYLPWLNSQIPDTVVVHTYLPVYYIYVPVIIFYIFCIIKVKKDT